MRRLSQRRVMTQQEQINELNITVKCKLGLSFIHGIGVFAMRDIQKGQKCYCVPPFLKDGVARWYHVENAGILKRINTITIIPSH